MSSSTGKLVRPSKSKIAALFKPGKQSGNAHTIRLLYHFLDVLDENDKKGVSSEHIDIDDVSDFIVAKEDEEERNASQVPTLRTTPPPSPATSDTSERTAIAEKYTAKGQAHGVYGLAEAVLVQGYDKDHSFTGNAIFNALYNNLYEILRTTDPDLVQSLISGNLSYEIKHNKALKRHMEALWRKIEKRGQPYQYYQQLVDKRIGRGPSKKEVRKIMGYMELCASTSSGDLATDAGKGYLDFLRSVDSAFYSKTPIEPIWVIKNRAYLSDRKRDAKTGITTRIAKKDRTDIVRHFCRLLRERLDACGGSEDDELTPPLCELGYATNLDRLTQHEKHQSSNYLINIAEAVCRITTGLGGYRIA